MPVAAATLPLPGADDAPGALACPNCHASVRPDQAWCTLCLTPFRAAVPEPETVPEPDYVPEYGPEAVPNPDAAANPEAGSEPEPATAPASTTGGRTAAEQAEIDRRADELLAQLAADPASNPPTLPPFLRTKARRTLAMVVGAGAFALVTVAGLTLLGVVFH